jgi:hypothetical protein
MANKLSKNVFGRPLKKVDCKRNQKNEIIFCDLSLLESLRLGQIEGVKNKLRRVRQS